MLKANWIWKKQQDYNVYNQTIIARKSIELTDFREAKIIITADSFYRLFINGEWINDGPCRSWFYHYQYDEIDVVSYLKSGKNQIEIIARYWGVGTFHNVCQQAGLLAQLEIELENGGRQIIVTDDTWEIAEANAWIRNVPKSCIQMEPQEIYDARFEKGMRFEKAHILFEADKGPWKNLNPRDVALLTKKSFSFKSFLESNVIRKRKDLNFCVPTTRLVHPGLIEANYRTSNASGMATILELKETAQIRFFTEGYRLAIDGVINEDGHYTLNSGKHLVLGFAVNIANHQKEKTIRIVDPPDSLRLINPIDSAYENPWCWISFPEHKFAYNDLNWGKWDEDDEGNNLVNEYLEKIEAYLVEVSSVERFHQVLGNRIENISSDQMFVEDHYWRFLNREVLGSADEYVEKPENLIHDNGEITIVHPSEAGDIELIYDLGEQNIGYYDFDLWADAGVEIDIYGVEYITPEGIVQHTYDKIWMVIYRNGMRYITKQGRNRFVSLKRRAGRYLFVTLRNQKSPVRIRKIQLIESTYPVNQIGSFQCSDARLDKIWEISARTLKLCMEDTFTDCPLYEQTFWVGDARNEAMFAYPVFDAKDIGSRCITLAGQSLERLPLVGSQVPSAWDCLLPAWSFLWNISVWDYYFYSGDVDFLKKTWQWVVQNLKGAEERLDQNGLFSAPFWNMFDWSGIDDQHSTVLHNSMLLVGAINAAMKCAGVIQDVEVEKWLKNFGERLCRGINKFWDDRKKAYPDSIHEDGTVSNSVSQHTSFLALLYDIIEEKNREAAIRNILSPADDVVKVGSPFAMMYFYETLEKIGKTDEIVKSIYSGYIPMIEAGATTVWEVFPSSQFRPGDFPTRSHAHAWSSSPLYFLNRIILGIKQTEPGGDAFKISPRLNGLTWANGTVATAKGPLTVSWRIFDNELKIKITIPKDVKIQFVKNETFSDYQVAVEVVERRNF